MKSQFAEKQYINVETYRKNGDAVQTPVWFLENQGCLYVRTLSTSGKVKRIRRNPTVKVTPCKVNGEPLGTWTEAQAVLADEQQSAHINRLLRKKYGIKKDFFDLIGRLNHHEYTVISIQLKDSASA